jgi:plastocyanin
MGRGVAFSERDFRIVTRLCAAWLVFGLCGLPGAGHAGVIRGTLRVPAARNAAGTVGEPASRSPRGGRAVMSGGSATDAVVYVEQAPVDVDAAIAPGNRHATLAQINLAFVPRVLAIAAGDTVDLPNFDPVYHNVFSLSPIKDFDLGRMPRGGSGRVVFERSGLVNVYCGIHSNMAAFVLVLPHHVFARPDNSGAFELPPLPAGHYTVCVWHPDLRGLRREVELEGSGDLVLELSL